MGKVTKKQSSIIAGLDIGTAKVVVVIGQVNHIEKSSEIEVIGVGEVPNLGMKKGAVVNIEATTSAIRKAREEAELMAGVAIDSLWLGISGTHVEALDSKGMVAIKDKEVESEDVDRVLEAAQAIAMPTDRQVLHVLPREYKVDEQEGVWDPVGMSGVRLEASVKIITGGKTAIQNSIKCCENSGLKVRGLVVGQLASAMATLSDDEKSLGVATVDIGGGTSDMILFVNGSVAETLVLPIGGTHFTHDVAVGLRTPQASAEILKKKYGCALTSLVNEEETIEVEGIGGRQSRTVLRKNLSEVIEPRAEETLHLIQNEIVKTGLSDLLGSGIVFTGGVSQLDGFIEMSEFIFDVPVRRGAPIKVGGLTEVVRSPAYSVSVGLLLYGIEREKLSFETMESSESKTFSGFGRRIKSFFENAL